MSSSSRRSYRIVVDHADYQAYQLYLELPSRFRAFLRALVRSAHRSLARVRERS